MRVTEWKLHRVGRFWFKIKERTLKKTPEKYPTMIMLPAEEVCALWVTKGREAQETLLGVLLLGPQFLLSL